MRKTKILGLALVASSLVMSACNNGGPVGIGKYTNRSWSTSLGSKWDPNTWETSGDSALLGYVSEGFLNIAPLNTQEGSWQWTYDMAKSVTDVTADHQDDLVRYGLFEEGASDMPNEGYVYEIELRDNLRWEEKTINGKTYGSNPIKADDFVESFKILLDPARKNYRANTYYAGSNMVANGDKYFYQGSIAKIENYGLGEPCLYVVADLLEEGGKYVTPDTHRDVYIALNTPLAYAGGSLKAFYDQYKCFDETTWNSLVDLADDEGFVLLTPASLQILINLINYPDWGNEPASCAPNYFFFDREYPAFDFENVGLYKAGDYKLRYVCGAKNDINNFKTQLTSSWLVENDLYKDLSTTDPATRLVTSTYNTSAETTISYGPYKMTYFEAGKQVKFTQNENYWGYTKDEQTGKLSSKTVFKVNGQYQDQWTTTDIVIDVLEQQTARQKFEKGELNDYTPTPAEAVEFARSSRMYKVDETYTMSFFFNTNLEALQTMDAEKGNVNSVVLTNKNFRKAFSLAINRADWVNTTEGYKPAYALLNKLYFYDVFNDPTSVYRNTDQAMKAIVDLYGVEYGEGTPYPTLKDAYDSITGYNLTEAKALMAQAYSELRDANLIPEGANIKIKLAYKKGAIDATDQAQVSAMQGYLNAALAGSGFGTCELEAVGNLADRYNAVPLGDYAIGYGAWGGAWMYPFENFNVYMDPDKYSVNERACWDPKTETFTLTLPDPEHEGQFVDYTMTYQDWSNCMTAGGQFADADFDTKLAITSALEKDYLSKYYRIPLAGSTAVFLLGYQQEYFTQEYSVMYDFGGLRLMKYNYDDFDWAAYVASQGGTLDYKS